MDTEEKRDRLYQVASSDPDPARRAKARELLATLPGKTTGPAPENHAPQHVEDEVTLQPGQKDYLHGLNIDPRLGTALDAVGSYGGAATMGLSDYLNDLGDLATGRNRTEVKPGEVAPETRAQHRQKFAAEHPLLAGTAQGLGSVTGAPVKLASKALGAGIQSLAVASPRVASLLQIPYLGSAVSGAAVGGTLGAGQGVLQNSTHPIEGAAEGFKSGAKFGAGLGVLSDAAGHAADLLSNDDLKLLAKYGLEPSPLPGTPVVGEDQPLLSAVKNPPLGTNTATPRTRQAAGLRSAEELAGGISEIEQANNQHLAQLRRRNDIEYGRPPHIRGTPETAPDTVDENGRIVVAGGNDNFYDAEEPTVRIDVPSTNAQLVYGNGLPPKANVHQPLTLIDALHLRSDLPNATRGRLGEVRSRLEEISDPATLEANPVDVQGVKALTRHLGNQDKVQGVTASDEALRRVARSINETLPPEMQAQDRAYAQARKRTEAAKRSLGLKANGTLARETSDDPYINPTQEPDAPGEGEIQLADPNVVKTAGNVLARRGEDTKAGANAEYTTDPLYERGMPRVMTGAPKPVQLSVRSLMDRPALEAAQERLQLNPGNIFSGAGLSGAVGRGISAGSRRFIYPALKYTANRDMGPLSLTAPDLVAIYRERQAELGEKERRRRAAEAEAAAAADQVQP